MSKPEDIPQDVWDVADSVLTGPAWNPLRTEAIARAIMAERERCAHLARTADEYLSHDDRLEGLSNHGLDALVERDARIADAIRNRGAA